MHMLKGNPRGKRSQICDYCLWTPNEFQKEDDWKYYFGSLKSESGWNSPNPDTSPSLYDQSRPRAAENVMGLLLSSLESSLLSTYTLGKRGIMFCFVLFLIQFIFWKRFSAFTWFQIQINIQKSPSHPVVFLLWKQPRLSFRRCLTVFWMSLRRTPWVPI